MGMIPGQLADMKINATLVGDRISSILKYSLDYTLQEESDSNHWDLSLPTVLHISAFQCILSRAYNKKGWA